MCAVRFEETVTGESRLGMRLPFRQSGASTAAELFAEPVTTVAAAHWIQNRDFAKHSRWTCEERHFGSGGSNFQHLRQEDDVPYQYYIPDPDLSRGHLPKACRVTSLPHSQAHSLSGHCKRTVEPGWRIIRAYVPNTTWTVEWLAEFYDLEKEEPSPV